MHTLELDCVKRRNHAARNALLITLGLGMSIAGVPAIAQEALGIKVAPGTRIYPELEVRGLYDSNFYYTDDNEETEFGTLINPAIGIIREGNRLKLESGARLGIGEFDEQVESDYIDGVFFASANYAATSRHRFGARIEHELGHDPFGLERTELFNSQTLDVDRTVDEFNRNLARGSYQFGADQARFNLRYELLYIDKDYDNSQALDIQFLNFNRLEHIGSLIYNRSPKARLLAQIRRANINYDDTNVPATIPERDFDDTRLLVGGAWTAAAKTTGRVLIGAIRHDSDDNQRDDFTEFDWEAQVEWVPSPKTTFTANTGRRIDNSFNVNASLINTKQFGASWSQRWSSRFTSRLIYNFFDQEFEGANRTDKFSTVNLEGVWLITRQIGFVTTFTYFDRDSDFEPLDFSKEIVSIGFTYRP